jgi:catechol 2,3-dioxygenase-like lactoylglutathione lyase family enzyme
MAHLTRIAPELPARDLQKAIRFYEQTLGFRLVAEFPAGDYAIVERDDVSIHLFAGGSREQSPAGVHIFTHELDELQAEFLRRGARLSQPATLKPWGTRDFRVNDEFGNELKFTEPAPDARDET